MTGHTSFDFTDRQVLVTGGTSGIGHGIATAFRAAGAAVTVTGTRDGADDYDVDLADMAYLRARMTEPDELDGVPGRLAALDVEHLDVLVNNAGANFPGGRSEWEPDAFDDAVRINLLGAFRLAVACKDLLAGSRIDGGGSVIGVASMASFEAVPLVPGYGAAKAGVVQMTMSLAAEWASIPIRANAVAPGLVESAMTAPMQEFEGLDTPYLERTPLRRWGVPADVAPVVLFLASAEARFVTGQTVCVDGGYSIS